MPGVDAGGKRKGTDAGHGVDAGQATAPKKPHSPSIWDRTVGRAAGLPKDLIVGGYHIAKDLPGEIMRTQRAANATPTLVPTKQGLKPTLGRPGGNPRYLSLQPGETNAEALRRQYPITRGAVESFGRTATRATHPGRLVHDYATDPVGSAIEDVSNVSLVLAPAAAVTRVGAMGAAGRAAEASLAAEEATRGVFAAGRAGPAATERLVTAEGARMMGYPKGFAGLPTEAAVTEAGTRAAATGARAASLLRLSERATGAARLGEQIAGGPAAVFTVPAKYGAKLAGKALSPAVRAFLETDAGQGVAGVVDRKITEPLAAFKERRDFSRFIYERGQRVKVEGQGDIIGSSVKARRMLPNELEQTASYLVADSSAAAVRDAINKAPEGIRPDLVEMAYDGQVPYEAFKLADEYLRTKETVAGRTPEAEAAAAQRGIQEGPIVNPNPQPEGSILPDHVMERMDAAQDYLRERVRLPRQRRYLRGYGASRELSDATIAGRFEQLGNQPLTREVASQTERTQARFERAGEELAKAQEAADRAAGRRILSPEEYRRRAGASVMESYRKARAAAATILRTDRDLAYRAAGMESLGQGEIRAAGQAVSEGPLIERLAGRLLEAKRIKDPAVQEALATLAERGVVFPDLGLAAPARVLRPAERQAGVAAELGVAERQAAAMGGQARQVESRLGALPEPTALGAGPRVTRPMERAAGVDARAARAGREATTAANEARARIEGVPGEGTLPVQGRDLSGARREVMAEAKGARTAKRTELADLEGQLARLDFPVRIPRPGEPNWDAFNQLAEAVGGRRKLVNFRVDGQRVFSREAPNHIDTLVDQYAGATSDLAQSRMASAIDDPLSRLADHMRAVTDLRAGLRGRLVEDIDAAAAERPAVGAVPEEWHQAYPTATHGPHPTDLSREQYVAEMDQITSRLDELAQHPQDPEFGHFDPALAQEESQLIGRLNELAPRNFDLDAPPVETIYDRLRQTRAEREGTAGVQAEAARPEQGLADVVDFAGGAAKAREASLATSERSALDAYLSDSEHRSAGGTGRPGYRNLSTDERKLYQQLAAAERRTGTSDTLASRREALVKTLTDRGFRSGLSAGRTEGTLRGRLSTLRSMEGQAEKRATTLEGKLGDTFETRAQSAGAAVSPAIERARLAGEREAVARLRERSLAKAERSYAQLGEKLEQVTREARMSPEAAPARFAGALTAANRLSEGLREVARVADEGAPGSGTYFNMLADDIPTTLQRMNARGFDPDHLIGAHGTETAQARANQSALSRLDQRLPRRRRTGAEYEKSRVSTTTPYTFEGQARGEAQRFGDEARNELAFHIEGSYGIKPAESGLELRGPALAEEMRNRKLVAWNPNSPFDLVPDGQVTPNTTFIPENLYEAFRGQMGPSSHITKLIEAYYDRPLRGIKVGWLALSPRWLTGNMVGNAMMTTLGGGVSPFEYIKLWPEARRLIKEESSELPRTLFNRGFTHEELSFMRPDLASAPRTPLGKVASRSFEYNSYIDDVNRSIVYLSKRAKGVSEARSVELALNAAGDFTRLSPFEKNVVKRAWIFYPWYRHITQLSLRLPIEAPLRVAWTMHLADMFGTDDKGLPPFLKGAIPLGKDRYLRPAGMDPFGDIEGSPLLSPANAVRGLTPAISWPAALLFGYDIGHLRPMTRPPGSTPLDAYGRERAAPLNPKQAGRYLLSQFPQGRFLLGATEKPLLRYGTGEPVKVKGATVPSGRSHVGATVNYLTGLPWPESVDAAGIAKRAEERRAAAAKARRRYLGG